MNGQAQQQLVHLFEKLFRDRVCDPPTFLEIGTFEATDARTRGLILGKNIASFLKGLTWAGDEVVGHRLRRFLKDGREMNFEDTPLDRIPDSWKRSQDLTLLRFFQTCLDEHPTEESVRVCKVVLQAFAETRGWEPNDFLWKLLSRSSSGASLSKRVWFGMMVHLGLCECVKSGASIEIRNAMEKNPEIAQELIALRKKELSIEEQAWLTAFLEQTAPEPEPEPIIDHLEWLTETSQITDLLASLDEQENQQKRPRINLLCEERLFPPAVTALAAQDQMHGNWVCSPSGWVVVPNAAAALHDGVFPPGISSIQI